MTIWIFGIGWLVAEAHELSNRARSRATHYASDGLSAVQKLRSLLSAHYSSMWNVLDLVLIGFVLLHILLTLIEQVKNFTCSIISNVCIILVLIEFSQNSNPAQLRYLGTDTPVVATHCICMACLTGVGSNRGGLNQAWPLASLNDEHRTQEALLATVGSIVSTYGYPQKAMPLAPCLL